MTREYILAQALKKMMKNKNLDEINVKTLTELCGVSRQTFYYHFSDIYELLAWIFLNETIDGFDKATTWMEAVSRIGRYCVNNRTFITQTYKSAGKDLLIEFVTNHLYQFHYRSIVNGDYDQRIKEQTRKRIALFYSSANSAILLDWIRRDMSEPLTPIIDELQEQLGDYLTKIFEGASDGKI